MRFPGPVLVAAVLLLPARFAAAQDPFAAARDLYASAAYEEALNALDRIKTSGVSAQTDGSTVEQYRALCLLALGRTRDAEHAIEEVVAAEPMYQPGEADASPRVRTAFSDVRRRMLPSIAQQRYAAAKATFDRKEYPAAAAQFKRTIELMDDPSIDLAKEPGLADLRALANGFLELTTAAAAPPAPAPVEPAPTPAAPVPAPSVVAPQRIYTAGDAGVKPPVVLRQDIPRWPTTQLPQNKAGSGTLEVLITETGVVESAILRDPVNRLYDSLLVAAAKNWKYRPAMKSGEPVRFRKSIQVTVEKK